MDIKTAEEERSKRMYSWAKQIWLQEVINDFPLLSGVPNDTVFYIIQEYRKQANAEWADAQKSLLKTTNQLGAYLCGEICTEHDQTLSFDYWGRFVLKNLSFYPKVFSASDLAYPEINRAISSMMNSSFRTVVNRKRNSQYQLQLEETDWLINIYLTSDVDMSLAVELEVVRSDFNTNNDPLSKLTYLPNAGYYSMRRFSFLGWYPIQPFGLPWNIDNENLQSSIIKFDYNMSWFISEMKILLHDLDI